MFSPIEKEEKSVGNSVGIMTVATLCFFSNKHLQLSKQYNGAVMERKYYIQLHNYMVSVLIWKSWFPISIFTL